MNPGFQCYTMRSKDGREEEKYHKRHWCMDIVLNQGNLEEVMEATTDVADKAMETTSMENHHTQYSLKY